MPNINGIQLNDRELQMLQRFKLHQGSGLSLKEMAGLAGQLPTESGLNPLSKGDHGTAYGLYQTRGDRQTALRNYQSPLNPTNEFDRQIDALVADFRSPSAGAAPAKFRAASPLDNAAITGGGIAFERPSLNPKTLQYARRANDTARYKAALGGPLREGPPDPTDIDLAAAHAGGGTLGAQGGPPGLVAPDAMVAMPAPAGGPPMGLVGAGPMRMAGGASGGLPDLPRQEAPIASAPVPLPAAPAPDPIPMSPAPDPSSSTAPPAMRSPLSSPPPLLRPSIGGPSLASSDPGPALDLPQPSPLRTADFAPRLPPGPRGILSASAAPTRPVPVSATPPITPPTPLVGGTHTSVADAGPSSAPITPASTPDVAPAPSAPSSPEVAKSGAGGFGGAIGAIGDFASAFASKPAPPPPQISPSSPMDQQTGSPPSQQANAADLMANLLANRRSGRLRGLVG